MAPGFSKIRIKPQLAGGLTWVNCTYRSVNGPIVSNWKKEDNTFELRITIPVNATASICLPSSTGSEITESGRPLDTVQDVKAAGFADGFYCVEVGSGDYVFVVRDI